MNRFNKYLLKKEVIKSSKAFELIKDDLLNDLLWDMDFRVETYLDANNKLQIRRIEPYSPEFYKTLADYKLNEEEFKSVSAAVGETVTITLPKQEKQPHHYTAILDKDSRVDKEDGSVSFKVKELKPVFYSKPNYKMCRKVFREAICWW